LTGLAGHFAGTPGVFFDTSVWSAVDLLGFFRLVPPEQILYASDYPYGRQPGSLLLTLRSARVAGIDEPALEPSRPRGADVLAQPMTLARIHQYLSMSMSLIFTRQQDSFGALGLAL